MGVGSWPDAAPTSLSGMLLWKCHAALIYDVEEHVNKDFSGTRHQQLDDTLARPGHGRREERIDLPFEVPKDFPNRSLWAGLTTIGLVVDTFMRGGNEHTEIRYDLSTLPRDVSRFAKCVSNHRGIENTCHWSPAVTYNEDGLKS